MRQPDTRHPPRLALLRRAPVRRRELFAALGIALSGLLLAACPRRESGADAPARPRGGSGYRRY